MRNLTSSVGMLERVTRSVSWDTKCAIFLTLPESMIDVVMISNGTTDASLMLIVSLERST